MEIKLVVGLKYESSKIVESNDTASHMGSGGVLVFSTPILVANLENAAFLAVEDFLPEEQTTVGTKINLDHMAATPVGMKVTFSATLVEIDNKRLVFEVVAFDEKEQIGKGIHERFIVNTERFVLRVNSKLTI